MDNVEPIHEEKGLHPDFILNEWSGELQDVVIVGYDKNGEEVYTSSIADGAQALWLLERAKHKLMSIVEEGH